MRLFPATTFLIALVFSVISASGLSAQVPELSFAKGKKLTMEKVGVVNLSGPDKAWHANMRNTSKAHRQGDEAGEAFREEKRKANEIAAQMLGNNHSATPSNKTAANEPTVGKTFVGNFFDEIPNDNNIAYSTNGFIVSVTNSRMYIYRTSGQQMAIKTFSEFFSGSGLKFDPKIVWDTEWRRFIFVFLNGDASTNSKVVVAFSQTDDPRGNWNVYTLTGNVDPGEFGSTWFDFPQIGINKKELFVTGNLFTNNNDYVAGYIYQIDKVAGFQGASSIASVGYGDVNSPSETFAIAPATDYLDYDSPHIWMVSTRGSPFGTSKSVWLHKITDSIGGSPSWTTYPLNATIGYQVSPDANQQGTSTKLDTRDTRVRGIYAHDERIYFGCNSGVNGKPGILFGEISGLSNPIFASATSQLVTSDSLEIAYPAPIYGGVTGSNGDHSTVLFFDYTSSSHYPGTAVIYIDENGNQSDPVICKAGQTYVDVGFGGDPQRWGDYSGISPNPFNPGEAWAAGYYGYSLANHRHGTWISQIYGPFTNAINTEPVVDPATANVTVYPNPTSDYLFAHFDVPANTMYRVKIYDLQGTMIKELLYDRLSAGTAYVTFDMRPLSAGTYLLKVENDQSIAVHSEKFIVTK